MFGEPDGSVVDADRIPCSYRATVRFPTTENLRCAEGAECNGLLPPRSRSNAADGLFQQLDQTMDWPQLRIGLHLALGSRRFGVNGRLREPFDSLMTRPLFGFGWSLALRPWAWPSAWRVIRWRMDTAGWK